MHIGQLEGGKPDGVCKTTEMLLFLVAAALISAATEIAKKISSISKKMLSQADEMFEKKNE